MGKNKQARVITKLAHLITKRSVRLSNQESLSASTSIKLAQEIKTYSYLIRLYQGIYFRGELKMNLDKIIDDVLTGFLILGIASVIDIVFFAIVYLSLILR